MAEKTLAQKVADAKAAGDTADSANAAVVADFLTSAAPLIDNLRLICGDDGLSNDLSFTARAKQVLQQIEVGLLKDPLTLKVLAELQAAQASS